MKQLVRNSGYQLWFSDCQAICWNNCSCIACNTVFTNGIGCQLWREKFPRAQVGDANQEELYVLSSSKDTGKESLCIVFLKATKTKYWVNLTSSSNLQSKYMIENSKKVQLYSWYFNSSSTFKGAIAKP